MTMIADAGCTGSDNQLATLERPDEEISVVVVSIDNAPDAITALAVNGRRALDRT